LVASDLVSATAIAVALRRNRISVLRAASLAQADRMMAGHQRLDGLVLDCDTCAAQLDFDWLKTIESKRPEVRRVLISAAMTPQLSARCQRLGIDAVLTKPFGIDALLAALQVRATTPPTAPPRVQVDGLGLIDVLQILHMNQRTTQVAVEPDGKLWMEQGEVVHAEYRGSEGWSMGPAAFEAILNAKATRVRSAPFTDSPRTINDRFQHLLLKTLTKADEAARDKTESQTMGRSASKTN
jgi:DNA-binding response OmpR family regulator